MDIWIRIKSISIAAALTLMELNYKVVRPMVSETCHRTC